jgi:hypothetical protein
MAAVSGEGQSQGRSAACAAWRGKGSAAVHSGGWSPEKRNRGGGSKLGQRSWRWRSTLRMLRAKRGERECMERVVELMVHMAEATVARSIGSDSGGQSSTRPAMAATAASVPARARATSEARASERELSSEGTRE